MRKVHRKLHFGHREPKGEDVTAFKAAVRQELEHLKLGFLYRMRTPASRHHTIARCIFVLGLSEKAHNAALRGEVGEWTQRKIRDPSLRSPLDLRRAGQRRDTLRKWRVDHRKDKIDKMFDAVEPRNMPTDAPCVAGYTGGAWPTYHELDDLFPHARHVSIAINMHEDADVLDVEPGDATPAQAPDWAKRQLRNRKEGKHHYNLEKPNVYCSVSNVGQVRHYLQRAGLLEHVNIGSAHVGQGEHICGPETCGYPGVDAPVQWTQWTWTALGRNLDQSKLSRDFF